MIRKALAALALMALSSCTPGVTFVLHNNSGQTIISRQGAVALAVGETRMIQRVDHALRVLRLNAGGCDYLYMVPDRLPPSRHGGATLFVFQIEPDLSIRLLPVDPEHNGRLAMAGPEPLPGEPAPGFPLRPVARDCIVASVVTTTP